jgi:hypothetical protein
VPDKELTQEKTETVMSALGYEIPGVADTQNRREGEWVLLHKGELAGIYGSFESAQIEAADRFRQRKCVIRQISSFRLSSPN